MGTISATSRLSRDGFATMCERSPDPIRVDDTGMPRDRDLSYAIRKLRRPEPTWEPEAHTSSGAGFYGRDGDPTSGVSSTAALPLAMKQASTRIRAPRFWEQEIWR